MAEQNQALIVQPQRELLPDTEVLGNLFKVAERVVGTPFVPAEIGSVQAAFAVMLKGRELGIPALASFAGIYLVHGRPGLKSELMLALIYRDHGDNALRITHTDDDSCTAVYKRRGWSSTDTYTYTMAMARQAGLLGDKGNANWKSRPANMLRARCISEVARMAFADSIGGLYTPEELEDMPEDEPRTVVTVAPTKPDKPAKRELADDAPCSARGVAVLAGLAEKLRGLTGDVVAVPDGLTNAEARELHLLISDALTAAEQQAVTDATELAEVL